MTSGRYQQTTLGRWGSNTWTETGDLWTYKQQQRRKL